MCTYVSNERRSSCVLAHMPSWDHDLVDPLVSLRGLGE